jgi:DNA-binding GntR family transcriptional regulator
VHPKDGARESALETRITERAYATIRQEILGCAMRPGDRFSESQLSESLGMGRTPIREALTRLRQEGLVESFPRSGYRVSLITMRDVNEIFQARQLIECEVAAIIAARGMNPGERARLVELAGRPYKVATPEDRSEWLRNNTEFHVEIARIAGNTRLTRFLEQILAEMERLLTVGWSVSSLLGQHLDLVEAIASGDPELARRDTAASIGRSKENTIRALMSSPALQDASIF